jgi:hypothetical protein
VPSHHLQMRGFADYIQDQHDHVPRPPVGG